MIEFEQGAVGRALMDWFAPGGHWVEVRSTGATLTSSPGFSTVTLQRRREAPVGIELDETDRRYKAGCFRQDRTFLECVQSGRDLPFPGCSLDDAVKTMEMIDAIADTGADNTTETKIKHRSSCDEG